MMTLKKIATLLSIGILLSLYSCASIEQLQLEKGQSLPISLGQIVTKEGALKNNIEAKGLPNHVPKMQVAIIEKELEGTALNKYYKSQGIDISTTPKEDLDSPNYLEIELINDIAFARAINENQTLKNYVEQSKNAAVVTKISCLSETPELMNGTTAYLEMSEQQIASLVFYDDSNTIVERVSFNTLKVLDYQLSYFCYGKDNRNQIAVMDLVEEGKHCKRPLERKVKNLLTTKKLVDY